MRELYTDLDITFRVENTDFYALNLAFERFLRSMPEHSHGSGSYEIHYISSGYGEVQISGQNYHVTPGTLYITGPHIAHSQRPDPEDPMCEYCVYLKAGRHHGNQADYAHLTETFIKTPFWFGTDTQHLEGLMQQLFGELRNQYTGYMSQVQSLLSQLVVSMVRNYEQEQKDTGSHFRPSSLSDSKYIILEEYFLYQYKDLSLEQLSAKLGLGERQTERLLKEHYGKTFLQKKTEAKMSAASILLADRSRTIASVAEELGYSSSEHFSAAFKNYHKISAREYRKRLG